MRLFLLLTLVPSVALAEHPLTERYLDGLFKAKPHLASFMGDHRFDGKIVDLSPSALQSRDRELVALQADLAKSKATNTDDEVDAAILSDAIGLELLYLREIRDWEWDPRLYDSFPTYDPREIVAARLADMIHGDYAPETERRVAVAQQLAALPAFLLQERAALEGAKRHPAKVYVDAAINDNAGRIEFFEGDLKAFTVSNAKAEAVRIAAVKALREYQTYLEKTLSTRADGDFRLGDALYRKKFRLALQTDQTPDQLVPRALASLKAAREEMGAVAKKLHAQLWPKDPVPSDMAVLINKVKDELAKDHAKPAELVQAHAANLDALRAFIEKNDLLSLPPRDSLLVEAMPAFKRGSSAAEYLAPGALTHAEKWHATYYVDPIDPKWPADKVESYLRGQNNYELQLIASHEAYPGHHTQFFYARRSLNRLRAVMWNAPFAEGWAVYGEGLMVTRGWGGPLNDRFRFYDLRGQMIVAANTVLDVNLHTGKWSDKEAVDFMTNETFQEQAMADKKLLRAKLDTTQLVQYYLGLDEIRVLEKDFLAKNKVAAFDRAGQRAFDEALIGHGTLAIKYLRRFVLPAKAAQ